MSLFFLTIVSLSDYLLVITVPVPITGMIGCPVSIFSRLADIFGPSPDTLERVFRRFSVEIVTNHTFALTGKGKTDVSTIRKLSRRPPGVQIHRLCRPERAVELSGGGWMDGWSRGPPHVKSRSYCSVARDRDGVAPPTPPGWPSPLPHHFSPAAERVWDIWTQLVDRPPSPDKQTLLRPSPDGGTTPYFT